MRMMRALVLLGLAGTVPAMAQDAVRADSATIMIPTGMGTLKQETISVRFTVGQLDVRFVPLEVPFLRMLAPDAEQALGALLNSQRPRIDSIAASRGVARPGVAMVSFFSATPNTRFDPRQFSLILQSGRLQPIGVIALSPGFSNQQLSAREPASGLVIFARPIPSTETFSISYLTTINRDWESVLPRITSERARILSAVRRDSLEHRP